MKTHSEPHSPANPCSPSCIAHPNYHWQRGYHPGELVVRSTMKIIARFENDAERNFAIEIQHSNKKMRAALEFVLSQLDPQDATRGAQHKLYSDCLHPVDDDKTVVDLLREALQ